ncbi:hypothetical protein R2601_19649 [Salipiger bermudensis HTCC2601]|uniref:Uncharacterized protein n=1 Tax=Salipiger bermudensis (strain DSM 26914 / JCM 13377 / KCTC 12554 / HTCC2601) TaxID=314265 RepID=Q0FU14_SALBH|nr:hypothetical protein R2601_19649 [Salipiger bermudensis HTCC2601]
MQCISDRQFAQFRLQINTLAAQNRTRDVSGCPHTEVMHIDQPKDELNETVV